MTEIDWNQFSKEELVEILEFFDQQPWLVERFDTSSDCYLGHDCSCDVGQAKLPARLIRIKAAASVRRSSGPLGKLLRNAGPSQHHQDPAIRRNDNAPSAISPTSLYRRTAQATGMTAAEFPPTLLSVLNGSDESRRAIDDAEADLTALLDLDNLDHLDIVHDFREFYIRPDTERRTATG